MRILKIIELLVFVITSSLFVMKLYEFIRGMQWAWHHGSPYADELLRAINRWAKTGFQRDELEDINSRHQRIWSPSKWPTTSLFWRFPSPWKEVFVNWIFRFPTLTITITMFMILSSNHLILISGIVLLWLGLWIVTIHSISYRLTHGYMDNYFSRTVSIFDSSGSTVKENEVNRKTTRKNPTIICEATAKRTMIAS